MCQRLHSPSTTGPIRSGLATIASWSARVAREYDLRLVGWTVDTHDWRGDTAEEMFDATREEIVAGSIVLAHEGVGPGARRAGAQETVRYLELIGAHACHSGLRMEALA